LAGETVLRLYFLESQNKTSSTEVIAKLNKANCKIILQSVTYL
jgi:hypothetical protein